MESGSPEFDFLCAAVEDGRARVERLRKALAAGVAAERRVVLELALAVAESDLVTAEARLARLQGVDVREQADPPANELRDAADEGGDPDGRQGEGR